MVGVFLWRRSLPWDHPSEIMFGFINQGQTLIGHPDPVADPVVVIKKEIKINLFYIVNCFIFDKQLEETI